MQYSLNKQYRLCGFKGIPYALLNTASGDCMFFSKNEYQLLFRLASGMETVHLNLSEEEIGFIGLLTEKKILFEATDKLPNVIPKYQLYNNRYKKIVHWSITGKCNAKCKHCFQSAPDAVFGQPSLEQCFDLIHQFRECGVFQIEITGGEPLIRSDFWQIIDEILKNGLHIRTIYSNGFLINQKLLDGFALRGISPAWQISFDGIGCHDWMRGIEGAEKMAIEAIKLLVQNDYSVSVAYSLYKESAAVFMESIKMLASLGVHSVKTGYMQNQGVWLNYSDHSLTNDEMLEFYKKIIPEYLADGRPLNLQLEGLFFGYRDDDVQNGLKYSLNFLNAVDIEKYNKCDVCDSFRRMFYVGPSGNVVPCMGLDGTPAMKNAPNVFKTPLCDILTESEYTRAAFASVKDVEKNNPECVNCEYRFKCRAGCRLMAIGDSGEDYLAKDKRTCMMIRDDWAGQILKIIEAQ